MILRSDIPNILPDNPADWPIWLWFVIVCAAAPIMLVGATYSTPRDHPVGRFFIRNRKSWWFWTMLVILVWVVLFVLHISDIFNPIW